jgi:hypothetical protein
MSMALAVLDRRATTFTAVSRWRTENMCACVSTEVHVPNLDQTYSRRDFITQSTQIRQ